MASNAALMNSGGGDGVSAISGHTLLKARMELREVPEKRMESIRQLRKAIESYRRMPGEDELVFKRTDNKFLLRFLRSRKFDVERALQVYVNYYKYRHKHREWLKDDASPDDPALKRIMESGMFAVLPVPLKDGSRAVCMCPSRWDVATMDAFECSRVFVHVLDKLLEDEEAQVHGITLLDNAENSSLQKLYHFMRTEVWKLGIELQDAFPARFRGLHFINQPWYISLLMSVVRPLLKQKHRDRFHAHGTDVHSFYQYVEPENLFADFGGFLPPIGRNSLKDFFETDFGDNPTVEDLS
jgi:retinaldehyde-binding protein 1